MGLHRDNCKACIWLSLVISSILSQCIWAQEPPDLGPSFIFDYDVKIDSSVIVGEVSELVIDSEIFVVTDKIGQSVFFFEKDGTFIRDLEIESCYPGRPFVPLSARVANEYIAVVNAGTPILRFDLDGNCLGAINKDLFAVTQIDVHPSGHLITMSSLNDELNLYDSEGSFLNKVKVRYPDHEQLESRWEGGGLVWWGSSDVIISGVVPDSIIFLSGLIEDKVERTPIHLEDGQISLPKPSSKLPATGSHQQIIQGFLSIARESTLVNDLFLLSENVFMLTILNASSRGYILFNEAGDVIESSVLNYPIIYASQGYVYAVVQPPMDENSVVPNPIILVYKYKPQNSRR